LTAPWLCADALAQAASGAPIGVYLLDEATHDSSLSPALAAGNYDGITVQLEWSALYPSSLAKPDFSVLDTAVASALAQNPPKKLQIGIQAGQYTPAWIYSAYGVTGDLVTFAYGNNNCDTAVIPRPYDPQLVTALIPAWETMLDHLATLLPAGQHIVTALKINGFNLENDQLRALSYPPPVGTPAYLGCPDATDGVALYSANGYTPSAVLNNSRRLASTVMSYAASRFPAPVALSMDIIPGDSTWPPINDQGQVYDPSTSSIPDLNTRITEAQVAAFPGETYVQANTLSINTPASLLQPYADLGAILAYETNAHDGKKADCGNGTVMRNCTVRSYGQLLNHGIVTPTVPVGGHFLEVHPSDAVKFYGDDNEASAVLHGDYP
jgi:hypothetical protein